MNAQEMDGRAARHARRWAIRGAAFLLLSTWGQLLLIPDATADVIPTHGTTIHLDPFVPPDPPSTTPGTTGEIVPVLQGRAQEGDDALNAPTELWHTEIEIEFLGGFDRPVFGAGPLGPLGLLGVATPGGVINIHFHQQDVAGAVAVPLIGIGAFAGVGGRSCSPGGAEVGSVCKALINLTDVDIAWGVSVTENAPALGAADFIDGPANNLVLQFDPLFSDPAFSVPGAYLVSKIDEIPTPEPGTASLLAIALAAAIGLRRRRRG